MNKLEIKKQKIYNLNSYNQIFYIKLLLINVESCLNFNINRYTHMHFVYHFVYLSILIIYNNDNYDYRSIDIY